MNWSSISLGKYQQMEVINEQSMSDIDKVLFSTCIVFDKTEYELDNSNPKVVAKMISKLTKIFETPFNEKAFTKIGKYLINYDISKITFGQYIELAFFLSNKPIQNAHYILATLSNRWLRKHTANDHRRKANYFLEQPVEKAIGALKKVMENFEALNNEYKWLFGLDKEVSGDSAEEKEFNKRYGWIYAATQVKEHEGITLDEAFALPIRQAFNALGYLKAKGKYDMEQFRKNTKPVHHGG